MSKSKQARFHVRARETVLKKGMMDYSITGRYSHFVAGDAVLTDERFFFGAELPSGEYLSFEFPLTQVCAVELAGVPLFTRSLFLTTDDKAYRLNSFCAGRWRKAIRRAVEAAKQRKA